jgi:putative FmdB family regulatory protein
MPIYSFLCEKCEHKFDQNLSMKDNDKPIKSPCPQCGKKAVIRDYMSEGVGMAMDTTLSPNKATGGAWNELMNKMKTTLPPRHRRKLDAASELRGGG